MHQLMQKSITAIKRTFPYSRNQWTRQQTCTQTCSYIHIDLTHALRDTQNSLCLAKLLKLRVTWPLKMGQSGTALLQRSKFSIIQSSCKTSVVERKGRQCSHSAVRRDLKVNLNKDPGSMLIFILTHHILVLPFIHRKQWQTSF